MVFSQTLAHLREQGIMRGLRQICHVDQVGLSLATSRPHCDQTRMMGHGPSSQGHFGTDLITGIYHCIYAARQEFLGVLRCDEVINDVNHTCRIDLQNTVLHGQHLGLTQRVGDRVQLTVDIRLGHMVHVDQAELPHAAARQTLHSPRAHTTHTHHDHMRLSNTLGP